MKKIYISPETMIVRINACPIMQQISGVLDKSQSIEHSEDFGSRRGRSDWDDEEDY